MLEHHSTLPTLDFIYHILTNPYILHDLFVLASNTLKIELLRHLFPMVEHSMRSIEADGSQVNTAIQCKLGIMKD